MADESRQPPRSLRWAETAARGMLANHLNLTLEPRSRPLRRLHDEGATSSAWDVRLVRVRES